MVARTPSPGLQTLKPVARCPLLLQARDPELVEGPFFDRAIVIGLSWSSITLAAPKLIERRQGGTSHLLLQTFTLGVFRIRPLVRVRRCLSRAEGLSLIPLRNKQTATTKKC